MEPGPGVGSLAAWEVDGDTQGRRHLSHGVLAVARTSPRVLARFGPSTPKRATARGANDHQARPEASSRQPAMMDVINLTGELHHSIETRKQIPACMALQWNETKDETALEKRFGRRHEDRRQVWWLSPDDRKWLRFPDRYHSHFFPFTQQTIRLMFWRISNCVTVFLIM